MLGHKSPLSKAILGHKLPLGGNMLGHKQPLGEMVAKMAKEENPMEKKQSNLERRIPRGLGWKLGMYA